MNALINVLKKQTKEMSQEDLDDVALLKRFGRAEQPPPMPRLERGPVPYSKESGLGYTTLADKPKSKKKKIVHTEKKASTKTQLHIKAKKERSAFHPKDPKSWRDFGWSQQDMYVAQDIEEMIEKLLQGRNESVTALDRAMQIVNAETEKMKEVITRLRKDGPFAQVASDHSPSDEPNFEYAMKQ
jgi:hypothetical protein